MRTLGIDYGQKRIGLAITDELTFMAHPLKVISSSNGISEIKKILKEYENIQKIVVGLPVNLKGKVAFKAKQVMEWVKKLKEEVEIPVVTWDERFSTKEAEDFLIELDTSRKKRKKVIDKLAARAILQDFIDATREKNGPK